jgi:hypothetical protein
LLDISQVWRSDSWVRTGISSHFTLYSNVAPPMKREP